MNDRSNDNYRQIVRIFPKTVFTKFINQKTIDFIVSNDFKPSLKLFCKRSRYLIETNDEDGEGSVIDSEFTDGKNTNNNNSKSGDDSIDNDYLITLDSDIMTTNRSQYVNDLTFLNEEELNQLDVFPHGHVTISSNDINLSNFENSLTTEIDVQENNNGGVIKIIMII